MKYFKKILTILNTFLIIACISAANNKQDPKCLLPMEAGPCRMSLMRFYYNSNTDTCEEFKFGGCKGNDNKFGFKQTCEEACKKSTGSKTAGTTKPNTNADNNNENSETLKRKQLNVNTLKTLTSFETPITTSTTTPKSIGHGERAAGAAAAATAGVINNKQQRNGNIAPVNLKPAEPNQKASFSAVTPTVSQKYQRT